MNHEKPNSMPHHGSTSPPSQCHEIINVSTVDIGNVAVSQSAGHHLQSVSLGSSVAVILYDALNKVAGLAHIALPDSNIKPSYTRHQPAFFADSGVPTLLGMLIQNSQRNAKTRIIAKIVGGASALYSSGAFDIGKRNVDAAKLILQRLGLSASAMDIGGNVNRSVSISVDTGKVHVSSPGRGCWEV
ncbi:chemotaxis protein CheD [Desulfovibrio inopinatus]|uniref:chemotaxis protein CheD n=1 Tax=Desulfovibrio inopinatus TaxID=102109 RepID=UPI000402C072|nr:chemotaxis protein CheD [Desulfovibrio inopinatus]